MAGAALLVAGSATAAEPKPATASEKSADKADKMICKRFTETGSLVRGYRTCKSKREWDAERDNIRETAKTSGSCSSGNGGCF